MTPPPWSTGANPAYLLDAIATLTGVEVTLHLSATDRPIVLTDTGSSNYRRHILMPTRLVH